MHGWLRVLLPLGLLWLLSVRAVEIVFGGFRREAAWDAGDEKLGSRPSTW